MSNTEKSDAGKIQLSDEELENAAGGSFCGDEPQAQTYQDKARAEGYGWSLTPEAAKLICGCTLQQGTSTIWAKGFRSSQVSRRDGAPAPTFTSNKYQIMKCFECGWQHNGSLFEDCGLTPPRLDFMN